MELGIAQLGTRPCNQCPGRRHGEAPVTSGPLLPTTFQTLLFTPASLTPLPPTMLPFDQGTVVYPRLKNVVAGPKPCLPLRVTVSWAGLSYSADGQEAAQGCHRCGQELRSSRRSGLVVVKKIQIRREMSGPTLRGCLPAWTFTGRSARRLRRSCSVLQSSRA